MEVEGEEEPVEVDQHAHFHPHQEHQPLFRFSSTSAKGQLNLFQRSTPQLLLPNMATNLPCPLWFHLYFSLTLYLASFYKDNCWRLYTGTTYHDNGLKIFRFTQFSNSSSVSFSLYSGGRVAREPPWTETAVQLTLQGD